MWYRRSNECNCIGRGVLAIGAALLMSAVAIGCGQSNAETKPLKNVASATAESSASTETPAEHGKYLVTTMGCGDCHTPMKMGPQGPEPDMAKMFSGHPENVKVAPAPKMDGGWLVAANATGTAWSGPWGISYTMNLTPDTVTGIGTWTEEMFIKTLRTGKHWGTGRPIMPPMPWPAIKNFSDNDLKAIYAYLRTVPPIKNQVPAYEPPTSGSLAELAPPGSADAIKASSASAAKAH
jgi:mono/diheme cytochrome c family protein